MLSLLTYEVWPYVLGHVSLQTAETVVAEVACHDASPQLREKHSLQEACAAEAAGAGRRPRSPPGALMCPLVSSRRDARPDYTILYYTILLLYYTILFYPILYCTLLYFTILYYTILYCPVLYCNVLYCAVLCCAVLCYTTVVEARVDPMALVGSLGMLIPVFGFPVRRFRSMIIIIFIIIISERAVCWVKVTMESVRVGTNAGINWIKGG